MRERGRSGLRRRWRPTSIHAKRGRTSMNYTSSLGSSHPGRELAASWWTSEPRRNRLLSDFMPQVGRFSPLSPTHDMPTTSPLGSATTTRSCSTGERLRMFQARRDVVDSSADGRGVSGPTSFADSHEPVGEVETVALRDLSCIDRVDLLKVDAGGYEKAVLEGFPWDRLQPDAVVAGFDDRTTVPLGYTCHDLAEMLRPTELSGVGQRVASRHEKRDSAWLAPPRAISQWT